MADHPTSPMSQTLANNTGIVACSRIVECDLRTTSRNRSGTPVTWPPYDVISVSTPSASGMALDFVAGDTNRSDVPTLLSPMTSSAHACSGIRPPRKAILGVIKLVKFQNFCNSICPRIASSLSISERMTGWRCTIGIRTSQSLCASESPRAWTQANCITCSWTLDFFWRDSLSSYYHSFTLGFR